MMKKVWLVLAVLAAALPALAAQRIVAMEEMSATS